MRHKPVDEIDAELIILATRRAQALDLLVRSLVEIAAIDNRSDVLLDRRLTVTPMIHR